MSTLDIAYQLLTETHTLLILDTETCPAADGGPPRVVQWATCALISGRPRPIRSALVDPGEPITNSRIHRITDAMVASVAVKPFPTHIPNLTRALTIPNTVLVAHNAPYDINVLKGEYARAGDTLPDLPVLDTMRLAGILGVTDNNRRKLLVVATELGIPHKDNHNAADDVRTTTKVLISLLRIAAGTGWTDLDKFHSHVHGTTTANTRRRTTTTKTADVVEPVLSPQHLADHGTLLPDQPTATDLADWVALATACVTVRCPLANDVATQAAAHAAALLPALVGLAGVATDPGQGGTLAGMIGVLAPHTLNTSSVLRWWRKHGPTLKGVG